jgi:hypothetical protein
MLLHYEYLSESGALQNYPSILIIYEKGSQFNPNPEIEIPDHNQE